MKETPNKGKGSRKTAEKGTVKKGAVHKDTVKQSAVQKDTAQKGAVQKDTAQKGAVQKDTAQKGAVQKDTAQKGAVQKDTVQKGAVQKDTAQKDAVQKDAVQKNAVQKGAVKKSTAEKSAAGKDAAVKAALTPILRQVGHGLKRAGCFAGRGLKRAGCCVGRWLKRNFGVAPSEAGRIALNGLVFQNPIFVLLLGMCPTLAVTTSLQNGLGMGLSTTAVLLCSNLVISLLRKVIPNQIRIASYIVIIATFVTAVDLLLQAFVPGLSAALGLYIPLIVVNCLILGRAEAFASRNKPGSALLDGLFMGLGFTAALAILGTIREILGAGTVWGKPMPVLSENPVGLFLSPCGGFITLGCLVALVQWLRGLFRKGGAKA